MGAVPWGADEDSVLFSLSNGGTGKVIADGASLIPGGARLLSNLLHAAGADLAQQIMKSLNKLP